MSLLNLFNFGFSEDSKNQKIFAEGKSSGIEEGIRIGMNKHFEITSSLSEDENELLMLFLINNNFILSYDSMNGGFRVRKNDIINPKKEIKIPIVDENSKENLNPLILNETEYQKFIITKNLQDSLKLQREHYKKLKFR